MKNYNTALKKFNSMYERCSTNKDVTVEELQIVTNYGNNLVTMYKGLDTYVVENKLSSLKSFIDQKQIFIY